MDAYRDEIFGPVLSVVRVDTYDEARRSSSTRTRTGTATAIFTRDGGVARQFQFDVNAGMVGINVPIPVPVAYYSFGGWKASLFGDRAHLRAGGDRLLHARQGRHEPLARPGDQQGRPRLPADSLARGRQCSDRLKPVTAVRGEPSAGLTCDQTVTYSRDMDAVFKALADPTRRALLDELYRQDGQSLTELGA